MAEGTIEQVLAGEATWALVHGDCRKVMATLDPKIVDAVVCDPPYELGFMGKGWDGSGVAFDPTTWWQVLRLCKPGAHLAAFGGTRTYHRIACAIEDGGFQVRDSLVWHYGSGFPKSKNLGGGIGTALKPSFEPIMLARAPLDGTTEANFAKHGAGGLQIDACRVAHSGAADLAAHQGQVEAIKARGGSLGNSWKNSSDLSGANDVSMAGRWPPNALFVHSAECKRTGTAEVPANPTWDTPNRATEPSAFTGSEVSKVRHANGRDGEPSADKRYTDKGVTSFAPLPGARRDETESVDVWECVDGCPVRELAMQSGEDYGRNGGNAGLNIGYAFGAREAVQTPTYRDTGSAARYFPQLEWTELDDITPFYYCAKAARAERDAGLDNFRVLTGGAATDREDETAALASPRSGAGRNGGIRNNQPTIKPIELIRWLVRLVKTRPIGGEKPLVLVPFGGAGSEMIACVLEGCRVIGIELNNSDEEPYVEIARARLNHAEGRTFVPRESLRSAEPPKQRSLWETGT